MQETFETFDETTVQEALPKHDVIRAPGPHKASRKDTAVGWDREKFGIEGQGHIVFIAELGGHLNTQVVLLRHRDSGERLLVASVHLEGFSIENKQLVNRSEFRLATASQVLAEAAVGDQQLEGVCAVLEDLATRYKVDNIMIGMDANSDKATHIPRFQPLTSRGYTLDEGAAATFMDGSIDASIKLDHIACRAKRGVSLKIEPTPLVSSYYSTQSYSDHSKVIATVSIG